MRLTTKGRYAIRALLRLATLGRQAHMPLREVAEKEDISVDYLNQLFFLLRKAGLIRATRGPGGGFSLARSPAQISVKNILDAVGEDVATAAPVESEDSLSEGSAAGDEMLQQAAGLMKGYFAGITLSKILEYGKDGKTNPIV